MAQEPRFPYGGQAVIEGVMIRGRSHFSLAVRRSDGTIERRTEPLSKLYTGRLRRVPLVRGMVALVETLLLGAKALQLSANIAMQTAQPDEEEEIPGWIMALTMVVAIVFGIGIFFVVPLLAVWALESIIPSGLVSEVVEGVLRLGILLLYIWAIGLLRDIKRVFAYHGAEHMTVHAYEAGLPLDVSNVRRFGTPHPRCGTAFLLTIMLVSIIVFALLMTPSMEWRIISRIALVPVIATLSYEIIRFSGSHQDRWYGRLAARPGLVLQRLTTRQPDDSQIEVAICAMESAIAADAGREYAVAEERSPETSPVHQGYVGADSGQPGTSPADKGTR